MPPTPTPAKRGSRRPVVLGALVLALGLAAGPVVAPLVRGHYTGNAVALRPWVVDYNLVVLGVHAVILALLASGLRHPYGASEPAGAARLRTTALALLVWALLAGLMMMALPPLVGSGPFAPDSAPLAALRALVFAPPVTRSAALALWLAGRALASQAAAERRLFAAATALLAIDTLGGALGWVTTPVAIEARLHAYDTEPLALLPSALAALLLARTAARP